MIKTVADLKVGKKYRWVADCEMFNPKEDPEKWIGTCKSIEMYDDGEIEAVIDFPKGILLLGVTQDNIDDGDLEEV